MSESQNAGNDRYVGTLVGESTSQEFRLAVAAETIREQDIIAVDAMVSEPGATAKAVRVWAKVQRIERVNPLFPLEAGHELAATHTDPFDTVLSLSHEMVTAVCQVLGAEQITDAKDGKLDHVRYPPQPASSAYRPDSEDIARIVVGTLNSKQARALDIASLSNRPGVDVLVNGHAAVTRHLAILAMTGAGKSWTARRVIEELAKKNFPIVIFDPHGDYTGLAEVKQLAARTRRYFARFPVFEEDSETVAQVVSNLGYKLQPTMLTRFGDVFDAAKELSREDASDHRSRLKFVREHVVTAGYFQDLLTPDMWLIARTAEIGERIIRDEQQTQDPGRQLAAWGWPALPSYSKTDVRTLEAIKKRAFRAAKVLQSMEQTNRKVAGHAHPVPSDRKELVEYGRISIISLSGYTSDFQATIFDLIAHDIFDLHVREEVNLPVLLVLEEAHNFAPARPFTEAEQRAVGTTRQIAQEGRKFGVGLVLISQRPSRLDETALSQCNSYVIMRMVNPADQSFVRRVIESLGEDEAKMLPDLDVGEAILSGQFVNFPVLVKIKQPESKGAREEEDIFEVLEKARMNENP
ncbi:MAG TPA: ATP-binding protein [Thermomicrobiaceae bacterium]|nr:ATP-binding protein [Thermomicrobiaceae bacterium]